MGERAVKIFFSWLQSNPPFLGVVTPSEMNAGKQKASHISKSCISTYQGGKSKRLSSFFGWRRFGFDYDTGSGDDNSVG